MKTAFPIRPRPGGEDAMGVRKRCGFSFYRCLKNRTCFIQVKCFLLVSLETVVHRKYFVDQ